VQSLRNIESLDVNFKKQLNVIYGENAQGKTSVLEAIYYLALTRSFRANNEKIVLKYDQEYFDIDGEFESNEISFHIRIYYSDKDHKHVFYNGSRIKKFSEIIGIVPVVLLSLEDLDISYGIPAKRRRFLDILLSQINPLYLQALQTYKRSLQNRNRLLKDIKDGHASKNVLFPWDEQLCENGSYIIRSRHSFIEFLNERLSDYYDHIAENNDNISTVYRSAVLKKTESEGDTSLEDAYGAILHDATDRDIEMQTTHYGPHREDLEFMKNGYPLKEFGSQGENKTFLVALKFAESDYLKKSVRKKPILLLDDIFGELDHNRIYNLMKFVKQVGQTFITTTIREKFINLDLGDIEFFNMKNGSIYET
jgi:DNA replication and repair protein RecF